MGDVWLTSDPHFGHALAAGKRGFATVEDHDAALMANYKKLFKPSDDVWWLGDLAFDGWKTRISKTIRTLPGNHHLIFGNHDRGHPMYSNSYRYLRPYLEVFDSVQLFAKLNYNGTEYLLSHFPYNGDTPSKTEDRFVEYRLRDLGIPLIHGHTHNPDQKVSFSSLGTKQFHVGVDAWGMKPVRLSELVSTVHPVFGK